ncbi:MAG TPA: tripartite tricarboxylate transporter substrate binding protein [Xanthobacteraceae bacterium]|nr:tripartite tricarboxylate transporter substrate binding protein [Xanthobacteraceae bacterium]
MDRRSFIVGAGVTAGAVLTRRARAQEAFPSHAITILNAFPPGGANDIVTRPFASALEAVFKQPVIVETKAGAGGQVGAQVAANAKPDGYTLLSHNNGLSGYAEVDKLFDRQPKVTRTDFIPLARLVANPVCLIVNPQQPYKTMKDFVEAAKKDPEKIIYSSGGLYGATHLPVAMMEKALGISKLRHLPTNGGGPAVTAVLGNNAHASVQTITATIQHIKSGKLRALAQFGAKRSKDLPDVPTMKELGYDVEYYLWVGIFAPKGTPSAVVSTLNAAMEKAAQMDVFKTTITNSGLEVAFLNAADFAKFWDDDGRRSEEAVRLIGRVQG